MGQCIKCNLYPWVPGADLGFLPEVKCHPDLAARRFMPDMLTLERECPFYAGKEEADVKITSLAEDDHRQEPPGQPPAQLNPLVDGDDAQKLVNGAEQGDIAPAPRLPGPLPENLDELNKSDLMVLLNDPLRKIDVKALGSKPTKPEIIKALRGE